MGYKVDTLPAYIKQNRDILIKKSVLGAPSVDKFTVQADSKGTVAINLMDIAAVLQDGAACGFSAQGDTKFSQRNIVTKVVKVNSQWCPKDLLGKYTEWAVNISAKNPNLPFEEYLTSGIIKDVDKQIETIAWQGNKELGISGVTEILKAETAAVKKEYAAGTSAYDIVKQAYMAIPVDVLDRAEIFVGRDLFREFMNDMVEKNFYHYSAGEGSLTEFIFPGTNVKVNATAGLDGTGIAVAGDPKGIVMGVDLVNDKEEFDLFYSKDDRVWKLVIEFVLGFQVAFPDQMVLVSKQA